MSDELDDVETTELLNEMLTTVSALTVALSDVFNAATPYKAVLPPELVATMERIANETAPVLTRAIRYLDDGKIPPMRKDLN